MPTSNSKNHLSHWPYPHWIAHRGAGKLAPENTLAAFRVGASYGYRMFECDVKLSADDVPFLLHDDLLNRTTNGQGVAGEQPWRALSQLDAGSWHSTAYAGEPLPSLEDVASFCIRNDYSLNIEIKPATSKERHTGAIVAQHAARLWSDSTAPNPLLSSFSVESLEQALLAAPHIPRGLLLDSCCPDWIATAHSLKCVAIICEHTLWTQERVRQAHGSGLRCLSYTVNDMSTAAHLHTLQTDGIITDRVDQFSPVDEIMSTGA